MADGYIDIDVKLNGSPAEKQADALGKKLGQQVQQGVDSANKATETSTKQALNNIGGTLTAFGAAYTKSVTLPIAAAAVATGASAVKIDTALTGVRKTVDGTEQQYEELKDAAVEFSKTNAVDPAQILDIQALGAQLGYAIDELDMFGEVVSGLDIATNMNAEEAATELAQFANIMGMAHDETKNYGSTIVELGNNFATTEADISHMAMRIAGAGKQIGMSEADVLGLATALSSMGVEAEAGGSAISTIMSSIDKDVAKAADAIANASEYSDKELKEITSNLEEWAKAAGMSADEFSAAWREKPVEALSALLVGLDDATQSGGNMSVMLDELGITSIRQLDAMKRLASNSEFLGKAVDTANDAWRENAALDKEVENRNNSMAAQLQILWNKVQAVAIEVGEPLMKALIGILDAADPLIDMLASGAQAFADLDEEGQQTVLMAVGIVAAFGPLTSVTGKVLSNVGKMSDGWASISKNLKAVNGNLKTTTLQLTANTSTWTKYAAVGDKASKQFLKWDSSTQSYVKTNNKLRASIATSTIGIKAQSAAQKVSNVAMKAGSVAAKTLGTALKTIAPVAILTVAVELFTSLSSAISKAKEEAQLQRDATKGLESASAGLNVELGNEGDAFASIAEEASKVDISKIAEEHRELANSIKETNQSAANSQGMLSQYSDAIQELAGRSDLSEEEVAKLKLAVDAVNEACGTSYEVVQDNAGAYQIMADGAVVAKDSVYDLIEAQKAQIRAQAEAENYKAVYEQMAKDQDALTEATKRNVDAEEALKAKLQELGDARYGVNQATGETIDFAAEEQAAYDATKKALDDVRAQAGSTQSSLNKLEEQQILTAMASEDGADALYKAADANMEYKSAVQGMGVDLVGFTKALRDMGFTSEQVAGMSTEDAMRLADAWTSGYDDMKSATEEVIGDIPQALQDMGEDAYNEAYGSARKAGQGFTDGLSNNAQAAIDAAINLVGMTREEFDKLAEEAGISGEEAAVAFAKQIAAGESESQKAGEANSNAAVRGMGSGDSTPQGSQLVRKFANAVGSNTGQTERSAQQQAKAAKQGMQSEEGNAHTWGLHLGDLFAGGIRAAQNAVSSAGNFLAGIVKNILGHTVAKEGPLHEGGKGEYVWGLHLVQNIASGMTSSRAKSELRAASKEVAIELSDSLKAEMMGIEPMAQLQASITQGNSALNMSSMMVGAAPSYTTNNQNLAFYGEYQSPDIIAREMRMQQHYGLAGQWL